MLPLDRSWTFLVIGKVALVAEEEPSAAARWQAQTDLL
jgi:hypothetical protein